MYLGRKSILMSLVLLTYSAFAVAADSQNTTTVPASPAAQIKSLPIGDVQRFTEAIDDVKKYYVDDVSDSKLFDNALRGMMSGLDPHSTYLDSDDYESLRTVTTGEFGGLGLEIASDGGYIRVVTPIDDTPAQKSGLKPGDFIIKIDNQSVEDMDLRDAVAKMRGKPGSKIVLTIYREGAKAPFNVTLTREVIHVKSVKVRMLEDGYGYLRISQFQETTMDELNASLAELKKENDNKDLSGLVVDLRNNPGGLLESAVAVSDAFLDSKKLGKNTLIVYTKGRMQGSQVSAHATPGDLLETAPIVVLVNEGSASAAEIVAGALQDQHRAVIMGTPTFGKGSVQTVLPLDDKTAIKITTALYYTPSGRSIQAKGIKPDVLVEMMEVKPNPESENFNAAMIREKDLTAHLANGNAPAENKASEAKAVNADIDPLAKKNAKAQPLSVTDYQLYEALNLLEGMNAVNTVNK